MPYDHFRPYRRSIRLKHYDYGQAAAYFVTICSQDRQCLFGQMVGGEMVLNTAGRMVEYWWRELPNRYAGVVLDYYVIMPNHLHGILWIVESGTTAEDLGVVSLGAHAGAPLQNDSDDPVGADRCVGPDIDTSQRNDSEQHEPTLPQIIQWYKTMTTNAYIRGVEEDNWEPFPGKLWQRSFYDRIIRNESELKRIREYIVSNPANWDDDRNNPESGGEDGGLN